MACTNVLRDYLFFNRKIVRLSHNQTKGQLTQMNCKTAHELIHGLLSNSNIRIHDLLEEQEDAHFYSMQSN